ncbi:RNA polymerase sigma factor [Posidoniimonas polymericola]|uniref:RNA polymerase sigma factor n=1 Tax=Posidoniimonas polymericola TaxID=2528002 RepID=A0A5C5YD36_9BACT|nr:sigma-70 family RNA polymerase sigma factor [Posidoniimonas polymericola]TWT73616.1 RNA polymerase sigma factor [Posidoniimonas polymericola]
MALSDFDRRLLDRCLNGAPRAWEDFVDRFMGLVVHVVNHVAGSRSIKLSNADREDLIAEVFLAIIENDHAVLRHFRGQSSLATYLTVISQRVVIRKLVEALSGETPVAHLPEGVVEANGAEQRMADREEVEALLERLDGQDAQVVRMYHLEGKSYRDISAATGMPENSVGPLLSRARSKLRDIAPAD